MCAKASPDLFKARSPTHWSWWVVHPLQPNTPKRLKLLQPAIHGFECLAPCGTKSASMRCTRAR